MNKEHEAILKKHIDYEEAFTGFETAAILAAMNEVAGKPSPLAIEALHTINEDLANLLADEDLTDEKLRDASEGLLPNLQTLAVSTLFKIGALPKEEAQTAKEYINPTILRF